MKHQKPPFSQFRVQMLKTVQSLIGRLPSHALDPNHIDRRRQRFDLQASVAGEIPDCGNLEDYPWGARIVLQESDPALKKQMEIMALVETLASGETNCYPSKVDDLAVFADARFFFLADHANLKNITVAQKNILIEIEDAGIRFIDFKPSDILIALKWVWQNKNFGGRSGNNNLVVLWMRDLKLFIKRFKGKKTISSPEMDKLSIRMMGKVHEPQKVVVHMFEQLFELERAWEFAKGLILKIRLEQKFRYNLTAMANAEASAVGLMRTVFAKPEVPSISLQDQAAWNVDYIKNTKKLRRFLLGNSRKAYSRGLGEDPLGYLIHILIWMAEEKAQEKGAEITSVQASIIYRFALNILCWIDPENARENLVQRISNAKIGITCHRSILIKNLTEMKELPSLFADQYSSAPILPWCAQEMWEELGSNLVKKQRKLELDRKTRGLRDHLQNPYIGASYWRRGWTLDRPIKALLDAWIVMHENLRKIDPSYASKKLKTKELKSALHYALVVAETPHSLATDNLFSRDIKFPCLFKGVLVGVNETAEKFHLGQKNIISGLSKNKIRLETNVFRARRYYNSKQK